MQRRESRETRAGLYISLAVLGFVVGLVVLPYQFRSEAVSKEPVRNGLVARTVSHEPGLENYDIRTVKSDDVAEMLLRFRSDTGESAITIADTRDGFVQGADELRTRVSTLKVEYNSDLLVPEVITPDVWNAKNETLTGPSEAKRAEVLRSFVKQNSNLVGIDAGQADSLKVVADYLNPSGNMGFAQLEQRIDGIPVFRGEIKAGFRKDGSVVRVINNLAAGVDYNSVSSSFGDPLEAVRAAAGQINYRLQKPDVTVNNSASDNLKTVFGEGDWATTAEKMYFPTEIGVVRPAWRVLIWQPVNAYYVIVDAETGTMLWRKNITEDQTESATYDVYTNPNSMINTADSPAPLTPGPIDPTLGTQAPVIARNLVTLIGNEGDLSFNNLGWMTDATNTTDGNALEAGIDRDGTNGVDATQDGDAACPVLGGTGCREFTSAWNPAPGNPGPGDDPLTPVAQRGAVIQMFYVMNRYHDILYKLGFNEQAFNFQNDNFGRGGVGGDRVSAEGQDSSGTNNANFSTPADGGRGRMQMYLWTGPTPDYDGTADADVIIHEVTHGTSNRLHGNTAGLGTNMSRGMGEGWGDFYGHVLLSEPSDPINGVYTTGGYPTYLLTSGTDTSNYYYGIRRFPKAVIAFTGGPGNLPHNPLTFANLNAGNCSTFNSAFPRGPVGSSTCDQVHNAGEIWSSALWEVRSLMVTRMGWASGSMRVLQVVTDGMKMAPLNPTFLQERDSIIAAAAAAAAPGDSADVVDVREGFRRRGMGFSAEVISPSPANVVEAFDFPNVRYADPFSVSDSPGDNDGFPEPGENVLISVPVENTTGATVTNVSVNINGGTPVSYGNIADAATVTMEIPYTIPASLGTVACGGYHNIQINVSSDVGAQLPVDKQFRLGAPIGGPASTFESADGPISIPNGQPTTTSGPANPYPSTISVSGLSGNKVISVELTDINHTWVGDIDMLLESPGGQKFIMFSDVYSSNNRTGTVVATLTLRDDAADTMPTSGVPPVTGTFKPTNSGADDPFDAPAPAGPYENPAPAGSATFQSAFGMDGSAMNGDWKLYIDDDAGSDPGTMAGWKITFESDDYVCSLVSSNARADFDGDGRTDISVFRPSEGNWYINGSSAGFFGLQWGASGDVLVPGDFDGDNKTDVAVARLSANPGETDFFVINSETLTVSGYEWGEPGDIPLAGDYNGDGKDDVTVYRPSDNTWYTIIDGSTALIRQYGGAGDTPIVGDFDGDGTDDLATFNGGTINAMLSGGGTMSRIVGGNINVSGDYDGDGKDDAAAFDTSTGEWRMWMSSSDMLLVLPFGLGTDIPAPGDYDGDGKHDLAIYRDGEWWVFSSLSSSPSATSFGLPGDQVIPLASTP